MPLHPQHAKTPSPAMVQVSQPNWEQVEVECFERLYANLMREYLDGSSVISFNFTRIREIAKIQAKKECDLLKVAHAQKLAAMEPPDYSDEPFYNEP